MINLSQKQLTTMLNMIVGKMGAEYAKNDSDSEITRCLQGCVAGPMLIQLAKQFRTQGENLLTYC